MDEALKKITHYQIFNFLLTGTVFAVLVSKTTSLNLISDDAVVALAVYYFLGLLISRAGSLLVGPLLRKLKIVKYSSYKDYLKAVKNDPKIDTFSQDNNMYRTFIAVFATYIIVFLVNFYFKDFIIVNGFVSTIAGSLVILTIFILSYRKQSDFIVARVEQSKR